MWLVQLTQLTLEYPYIHAYIFCVFLHMGIHLTLRLCLSVAQEFGFNRKVFSERELNGMHMYKVFL